MPDYGWGLTDETPEHKVSAGDCPTCPAAGVNTRNQADMALGELAFVNRDKDTCRIGFSRILTGEAVKNGPQLNFTIILVDYEQKKK